MHTRISPSTPGRGIPPAARNVLSSAKGSAKTVWLTLMSRAKSLSFAAREGGGAVKVSEVPAVTSVLSPDRVVHFTPVDRSGLRRANPDPRLLAADLHDLARHVSGQADRFIAFVQLDVEHVFEREPAAQGK